MHTLDMSTLTSDLPTLLGVSTGIAVLGGLICMVLHLFSKTKYPRHRQFTDNNLPPPIMYSSDTGKLECHYRIVVMRLVVWRIFVFQNCIEMYCAKFSLKSLFLSVCVRAFFCCFVCVSNFLSSFGSTIVTFEYPFQ